MITNRIWNELCDAKKNEYYLSAYLASIRSKKKRINFIKIIIALAGIIVNIWLDKSSLYTLISLTLFEVLKEFIPYLSIDENLVDKIPEYRMLYVNKFQELDALYLKVKNEIIPENEIIDKFLNIRQLDLRIQDIDNSIHLPEKKKIFKKAEDKLTIFIQSMYNFE